VAQIVQVDFTIFRLIAMAFVFLVSFAGIFITIGRLLNKQKVQCKDLKIINGALWKDGRPLLQSVEVCKEERDEFKILCREIIDKLNVMDKKQDESNVLRSKQIQKITLHMQKIDLWYKENHKG
jgi:hypothetical protein